MKSSIKPQLNFSQLSRTKIIATLGPATDDIKTLYEMFKNGVSIVRLNFSHGSIKEHQKRIELVNQAAKEINKTIGIIADLQGQKIRISQFKNNEITLKNGNQFILNTELGINEGDETQVAFRYPSLISNIVKGDFLLLDDGLISLKVSQVSDTKIYTKVVCGGVLSNNKGVNKQGGGFAIGGLTTKDKKDIQAANQMNVDFIAVSFVRNASDIKAVKKILSSLNSKASIISKIERSEAVSNIDSIIDQSDIIMIARGDLGVEVGDPALPFLQKKIIQQVRDKNKVVITATQMMSSMTTAPVPTRSEICDVANAVIDGTDAVMLSAETSVGKYPIQVVKKVNEVCLEAEKSRNQIHFYHHKEDDFKTVDKAISFSAIYIANHLPIKAIIAFTSSGKTPLYTSRIYNSVPIYAVCYDHQVMRQMAIYQGVIPVYFPFNDEHYEQNISEAIEVIAKKSVFKKSDIVVVTRGEKNVIGGTNILKIVKI